MNLMEVQLYRALGELGVMALAPAARPATARRIRASDTLAGKPEAPQGPAFFLTSIERSQAAQRRHVWRMQGRCHRARRVWHGRTLR